ncbi:hypothetical protein [Flavipsychrobacter stenotrophus]|uniref:hypothetical protein n=1 Tax=Flavipsychrobacter stenotrophus TaxID=2077091 RepID=UPI00105700DA|nr:hypothetical protein [Flavipsychrobacter stenotrophus]
MRNCVLLSLLTLTLLAGSCSKSSTNPPISILVDTVTNAYLNHDDSLHLPFEVRFLTGNFNEEVSLTIEGLPPTVKMVYDTIKGIPTFTADFVLYTTSAAAPLGYYPVRLVTYSYSTGYKTYDFTLGVVHYNCSSFLTGSYTCQNACATSNYNYTASASASGNNILNVVNFGGYGLNTNTRINLDCNTDSVTITRQLIGNGVTVTGHGHFEANKLVIAYTAENIPTGGNDNCTVTMNK